VTPRVAQSIVVAATAVAVLLALVARLDGSGATGAADPIRVRYVYSTDAASLVEPLVARFNRERHRVGDRDVFVVGEGLNSGEAEALLARGERHPALWTPASSLWPRLLTHDAHASWSPPTSPSLVFSPQVIAMWHRLARALGYPRAPIGWKDILALATSTRGWGAYGHPEFGPFRLGHTNPNISTSGLSAIVSEYYALTGKRAGLTLADVHRADVRARVRTIEQAIVHYGETASAFTDQMALYRESYAHAVYIQETQLRSFNKKRHRLDGIHPAEGTFVADYPLIVLRAPWVDRRTRSAALAFRRWLRGHVTAQLAAHNEFSLRRPTKIPLLEPPTPDVLAAIRDGWRRDRKPANIVLVVDSSSSMSTAGRLDAAKVGLLSFLRQLSPRDRVALVTSGAKVATPVPLGPPARSKPAVARSVRRLFPNGERPVYPAIALALAAVRSLHDSRRINAVVVLSDGAGTMTGYRALVREIQAEPVTEGTNVRVFSVSYGDDADGAALERIATLSRGKFFAGGPKNIDDVYGKIAAYF